MSSRHGLTQHASGAWLPNTQRPMACTAVVPLASLGAHEQQCPAAPVQCSYAGCRTSGLLSRDLLRHEAEAAPLHLALVAQELRETKRELVSAKQQLEASCAEMATMRGELATLRATVQDLFRRSLVQDATRSLPRTLVDPCFRVVSASRDQTLKVWCGRRRIPWPKGILSLCQL